MNVYKVTVLIPNYKRIIYTIVAKDSWQAVEDARAIAIKDGFTVQGIGDCLRVEESR